MRETLDLGAIMAAYARALEERLDFMAVSALERPDFRTVSDFRKRHLEALAGLFGLVLRLCREAGLVVPVTSPRRHHARGQRQQA